MHKIMAFIWPMIAASAEAMMWFWLVVILAFIGKGKILPSENAIIIDRRGQYKMRLAPGLNLAQPFIETLAELLLRSNAIENELMLCFEVRDKNILSRKQPFYLLTVSFQNNCLSFDASPAQKESVSHGSMPFTRYYQTAAVEVENVIHTLAKSRGVDLHRIGQAENP